MIINSNGYVDVKLSTEAWEYINSDPVKKGVCRQVSQDGWLTIQLHILMDVMRDFRSRMNNMVFLEFRVSSDQPGFSGVGKSESPVGPTVDVDLIVIVDKVKFIRSLAFDRDLVPVSGDKIETQCGYSEMVLCVIGRQWRGKVPVLLCAPDKTFSVNDLCDAGFERLSDA